MAKKVSQQLKRSFKKSKLVKGNEDLSFKSFVKKLAKDGDEKAQAWISHKKASWNKAAKELRIKTKGTRISLEKSATKMARRKKGERSRSKNSTTTT